MIFDMAGFVYAIVKTINSKLHVWNGEKFSAVFDEGVESDDEILAQSVGGKVERISETENGGIELSDL